MTRSGTNNFIGSGYEYYRSDKLNANTWFNNRNGVAKPKLKQNQTGFRVGGPIVLPGFDGHNKAFFFVNYEELRQPADTTRTRTVLNPARRQGNFCYAGNCVNVLALAAANGQLASVDPTIGKLLADIRSATGTTGTVSTDRRQPRSLPRTTSASRRCGAFRPRASTTTSPRSTASTAPGTTTTSPTRPTR